MIINCCSIGMNLFYFLIIFITVVYYYRTHPILFLYFFFISTFLHFLNFFITGDYSCDVHCYLVLNVVAKIVHELGMSIK